MLRRFAGPPRARSVARALAWTTILLPLLVVVSPWLLETGTYGLHDWDFETSNRYLTKLSLLTYGQAPFWNPYACGGFPAWGFIEGGTTLISPWLVPYLLLPIRLALRVEVIGSALLGSIGAFKLAGRFTRSFAARSLVVAIWAVDGRWALQAATGHTWHLLYAWMPWCFYFYERSALPTARAKHTLYLALCFAMLLYGGGIYPLPHVVLALSAYALILAIASRSLAPVTRLLPPGVLGVLLSAPKLLPMLHELARAPRLIESNETTSLHVLWLALTAREQTLRARLVHADYAWHEYGMYVGIVGVVVLAVSILGVWGRKTTALKIVGLGFCTLGFGAFHAAAPWTLLHAHVPFFGSQHVPSRFFYPALLLLAVGAAAGLGRVIRGRSGVDAAVAAVVLAFALDVAVIARKPMAESMRLKAPDITANEAFQHDQVSPYRYWPANFAMPSYLSMLGNRGVIECYGIPATDHVGARSVTDPRFDGEVTVAPPSGGAAASEAGHVVEWSPNRVTMALTGALAGSTVLYNMSYDDGWTSDDGTVIDVDDKVAIALQEPRERVTVRYWPRLLVPGLLLGALGALLSVALLWRDRRDATAKV